MDETKIIEHFLTEIATLEKSLCWAKERIASLERELSREDMRAKDNHEALKEIYDLAKTALGYDD